MQVRDIRAVKFPFVFSHAFRMICKVLFFLFFLFFFWPEWRAVTIANNITKRKRGRIREKESAPTKPKASSPSCSSIHIQATSKTFSGRKKKLEIPITLPFYRKTVVHRRRSLSSSHFHIRTVSTNRLVYYMYATITWWCFCSFILFCCVWVCVCVSVCWWLLLSALYGKRRPTAALVLCNMPARHSFPCV